MKIYGETTGELIESPNLEAGYTYPGRRYVGTKRVVLGGTVDLYPPGGLEHDKPVYEDCQLYHEYTEEELEAINQETGDDTKKRIAALEEELQAAKILLGGGVNDAG